MLKTQTNFAKELQVLNQNIAFIDTAVTDYQSLIAGIKPGISVVVLNSNKDGVEQITQALQGGKYKSVHIVSHGSTGSLQLGYTQLNSNNLNYYTNQLQQWRNYLSDDADILLYGCDVANGEGTEFVEQISQITGANVAASTDKTGSKALGGNWDFEFKIGKIESSLAFKTHVIQTYDYVLAGTGDVIINEFSQGSDGAKEWVELLVVRDNVNLQNHTLVDGNGSLNITLSGSGFSSLKAGTLIVLYNGGDIDATITPDLTYDPTIGDYVLKISSLNSSGVYAVTRNNSWDTTTEAFNNTDNTDVPQLLNSSNTPIYTFPRTTTPTTSKFSAYTSNSAVGATNTNNWSNDAIFTSATPGLGNTENNTTWINILRGAITVLTAPSVTINNPSPAANEQFGFSLASNNTNILIGAPLANSNKGEVYQVNINGVLQQTFTNPSSGIGELFGFSVAMNDIDYLIGAPKFDDAVADVGRAYKFNASGSLQQTFNNSVNNDDSEFGSAVAILSNGNYVIGAPEKGKVTANDNAGQIRLFDNAGVLQTISNPGSGFIQDARFGFSLAAANNDILIGTPGFSFGVGQVDRYNTTGTRLQTFTNPNPTAQDFFGFSVKSNSAGTRFLIGAPGEDNGATDAGVVYLYDSTTATPTLLKTFTNPDITNLGFGSSLAFLDNDILIGASGSFSVIGANFTPNPVRGAVYLYDGDGASPTYKLEKIFSNPGTSNDAFGAAISIIDSNRIAISAPYYDADTNTDAGIAYIFNLKNAPVLDNTGNPTLVAINENSTNNDGTLISAILATGAGGNPISDADAGAVEGIAVIGVDNTNGKWQYSTNGGNNWIDFAVSNTSATLLRDTEKVRFIPNANYKGKAEITFRAWDASDGKASGTTGVDVSVGGGTTAYSAATETASITIALLVGLRPYSIVTGDFNKDGNTDLVTANKSSQSVSVLLGKGDGTFNPASNFSVVGFNGLNPYSVAVADFNKDGNTDLVTANNTSSNISVLFGDGKATGGFGPAINFALPSGSSSPVSIAMGDFNKDGKSDIVTANNASQNVSVLLGDGNGGFAVAKNFRVPSRPTSVTVGDFNGDGKSDLAVTSSYFNNVSILLGNGDGTFNSATQFDVGTNPHSVIVGDFDKDGKSDLAVANSDSNNVSVLLGNGDGTFKPAANFNVGLNPVSVTVIDFNGDEKFDLAVANADSNTVSVLLGDGTGSFGNATNFDVGTTPYAVTVGDFDKDGKSDLAVANSESKNVSVLFNNPGNPNNPVEPVPPQPILINEILFDPPSTDGSKEYIELRGTPGATLAPGTYLVGIEGDSGSSNPGNVQDIFDLSGKQFGSNGLLVLLQKGNTYTVNSGANVLTNNGSGAGWGSGASSSIGHTGATDIENNSVSFFLIQTTSAPILSNDIDSNNDGIADGTVYSNWTVLDSVSVLDGTSTTDRAYSSIVFRKGSTGGSVPANATVVDTSFIAGYVGRSSNTTGSTASDWVASLITGTAPNLTLGTVANTSPGNFAEQPLNHIGDTNFAPGANLNYAISTTIPTVTEGNSGSKIVNFTVTRSGNTAIATTVNYVLDGTATSGSDYNNIKVGTVTGTSSGTLKFAVGETTKTISLNVLGEKVTETDETINLNLNYPNQTVAIAPGTITIVDDDNIPTISIVDKSGSESAGNFVFTVKLSNASSEIVTVAYNTSNDTAIAGVDYTAVTGSLTFNPGVTTQTITVPILNDFVAESGDRFFVNLINPTNASIGDNQAIGTITDNDTAGFTISPLTGLITTEAGGTANFSIQLTSQPTANVTLNLSSSNVNEGTVPVSSITFTAANWNTPQVITVTGVNDGIADDNIAYKIITGTVVSSDAKYNNFNPANIADIDVINIKNGNQVNSVMTGSAKVDNLQGTTSDDLIFGFASNDVIVGGLGNDQIYGGLGVDNLTGGAGNDIFVLAKGEGRDTIRDFKTGEDLIALAGGLLYSGLSVTQSGSATLIKVTANNESLALLTGIMASTLNASDFITISVN
ncbi:DUF4347 domain-containing protein [Nostoc commune]|nr:DUF4347 domain-containing protein [Nostoc commune]